MFVSLDDLTDKRPEVDVIIVGSGPAGLPIADVLLSTGARVLLVESGDLRKRGSQALNATDEVGLPLPSAVTGRRRVFGGTGQEWSGQCLPMDELDFAERPWVAQSGWPITAKTLAPYYAKAEEYFGITGCTYDLSAYRRGGTTLPVFDDQTFIHRNTVYSPKHRVGSESKGRLAKDQNLTVVHGATVRRVLVSANARQVTGVEAVGRRGHAAQFHAPTVVIACGSIENARLLLLSGDGPSGLGNTSGHVGRHFQEHPFCSAAVVHTPSEELMASYRATFEHGIRHRAKTALAPEYQRRHGVLAGTIDLDFQYSDTSGVAATKRLDGAWSRRRLEPTTGRDVYLALRDPVPVVRLAYRRFRGRGVEGETPQRVLLRVQSEQAPSGQSQVRLSGRRDLLGVPLPTVDWQVGDQEWRTTRALTTAAQEVFADLGLGCVEAFDWLESLDGYRAHVVDTYHHAGTTRMSEDAGAGVVDPNCQVHGVDGLYVAGGSVFPTSGYANPTLTVVAMSMRLADFLTSGASSIASATPGRS